MTLTPTQIQAIHDMQILKDKAEAIARLMRVIETVVKGKLW